jgi:RNA polymerase sigma-70 factor, ECF subfamily
MAALATAPPPQRQRVLPPAPRAASATAPKAVTKACAGDSEAFGSLYRQYRGEVHGYIQRRVTHHELADDLCSETFLRAFRRISSFAWQGRDFGAWLTTIAHNLVIDYYKSSYRKLEVVTEALPEDSVCAAGADAAVLAKFDSRALADAMSRLTPAQRACVSLRLLDGYSVEETATSIGRSGRAIIALQHRALRSLARELSA